MKEFHGESSPKSPEYSAWSHMLQRCEQPKTKHYNRYGGRGISVCKQWATSYTSFLDDVGRRPSELHTLDRIDNDGNYEPTNVRWANMQVQTINRGSNKKYTSGHKGVGYDKRCGKYFAQIKVNYKSVSLGRYDNISEAVNAREKGEVKYFTPINN